MSEQQSPHNQNILAQQPLDVHRELVELPGMHTEILSGTTVTLHNPEAMGPGAINQRLGSVQDIHGVIRAGEEVFGLVRAQNSDATTGQVTDKFILTRFAKDKNERATIIGVFEPGLPIAVGRNFQKGMDGATSREHFTIQMDTNRNFNITDNNSTNKTKVTALGRGAGKDVEGPLKDFNLWAPNSRDVINATAARTVESASVSSEAREIVVSPAQASEVGSLVAANQLNVVRVPAEAMSLSPAVEAQKSQEQLVDERLQKVFKPLQRPTPTLEDPGFDHFFSDDPAVKERYDAYSQESEKIRPLQEKYDKFVDEQGRQNSAQYLERAVKSDKNLSAIINQFKDKINLANPLGVVDAIRTDPDVRLAVGKYFLQKVNSLVRANPNDFGNRIVSNSNKATNGLIADYVPSMSSREYASALAMAMVDGSFNGLRADDMEYDDQGRVLLGQHRDAARAILQTPMQ